MEQVSKVKTEINLNSILQSLNISHSFCSYSLIGWIFSNKLPQIFPNLRTRQADRVPAPSQLPRPFCLLISDPWLFSFVITRTNQSLPFKNCHQRSELKAIPLSFLPAVYARTSQQLSGSLFDNTLPPRMETLESLQNQHHSEWNSWLYHQHNLQVSYVQALVDMLDLVEECTC